jgi:hypothetical protein
MIANMGGVNVFTTLTLACAVLDTSLNSTVVTAPDSTTLSCMLQMADPTSAPNNLSSSNTIGMTGVVGTYAAGMAGGMAARGNFSESFQDVGLGHACNRRSETVGDRRLSRGDVLVSPPKGK